MQNAMGTQGEGRLEEQLGPLRASGITDARPPYRAVWPCCGSGYQS